ncbi:tetratricopeptide repeat protein [bacterium]|nr:tetratricopeptide repeat protein [bacterium]
MSDTRVDILYSLGEVLHLIGNWHESKSRLTQAYNKLLGNIGIVHWKLGNYNQAMNYYRRSQKISIELGDKHSTSNRNIAELCLEKGELNQAEQYARKQLMNARKIKDTFMEALALTTFGLIYNRKEEFEQALACFEQALEPDRKLDDQKSLATIHLAQAEVYYHLRDYIKARKYCDLARNSAQKIRDRVLILDSTILSTKITRYRRGPKAAQNKLMKLLDQVDDDLERAEIHYELSTLSPQPRTRHVHRRKALHYYQQLAQKRPLTRYVKRIAELKERRGILGISQKAGE